MLILRATLLKQLHKTRTSDRSHVTEAVFKTTPYRLHRLNKGPDSQITLKREQALSMYSQMVAIRRLESTLGALYRNKVVRGFCHLYSGQEAVAVGVYAHIRPEVDVIVTSYRCHGWAYLTNGFSLESIVGELVGVKSGSERGKGGSMHIYNKTLYGGNAIVGAQVPLGVGVALAFKYQKRNAIAIAAYGDGASDQGQVFEAFNIAKLLNLPCLFLCENNQYSMGTSLQRHSANTSLYTRGDVVPGIQVDGMDVPSVYEAMRFVKEYMKAGHGPLLLEALTYRYSGHSLSDPGTSYRTREEISSIREKRDPITMFKNAIVGAQLVTENEVTEINNKMKKELDEAVKKAQSDKSIGLEELTHDIYANDVIKNVRGVAPFKGWKHKHSGRAYNPK